MPRTAPGRSPDDLLTITQNSTKLLVALLVLVVFVAVIVGYSISRTAASVASRTAERADADGGTLGASLAAYAKSLAATAVPTNILRAADPGRAQWRSLLQPPTIDVAQAAPDAKAGASAVRSDTMAEIQKQTREDGALRAVAVDGKPVSPQLVADAVFGSRNFATRANYEFPQFEKRAGHDKTQTRPRSMFGPLTAPLAAGGYAMDIGGKIVK
jgi:hypothetical protein